MPIKSETTCEPTLDGFVHYTDAHLVLSAYPKRIEGLAPCPEIEQAYGEWLIEEALEEKYGPLTRGDGSIPAKVSIFHDGNSRPDNDDIKNHRKANCQISISLVCAIAEAEGNIPAFEYAESWRDNSSDGGSFYWFDSYVLHPLPINPANLSRVITVDSGVRLLQFGQVTLLTANATQPNLIVRREEYLAAIASIRAKKRAGHALSKAEQFSLDFHEIGGPYPRGLFEREHESNLWRLVRETKELRAIDAITGKALAMPEHGKAFFYDLVDRKVRRELLLSLEDFKKFAAIYQIKVVIEDEPEAVAIASETEKISSKGKPWTEERLKEVAAYRQGHGTKAAAEHFGISTALIRGKLPSEKTNKRNSSPFGNMTNTLKR
jgi:hypothetical protein